MKRHLADRTGFTLVEMMVAVGILGIALAIAVPSFRGTMDRARVDQVESHLQSDLRLAMSRAKATGRAVRISFEESGYRVVDAADSTRVIRRRDYGGSVRVTASGNPLVFPWGLVQPADLNVSHRAGSHSIMILPTGRIEDPDETGHGD
ncbi:MAG TPA: GspH/FimT family pseudopilin [Candidatus Krumholzibacteria bacterium]|nr:GspH/FimT family pseudopilin [Candidatus Krumholzibacteria bacterium]